MLPTGAELQCFHLCVCVCVCVCVCGCETWSLMLREDHRLKVFEKRVLRKILGFKWDEVRREWRGLLNDKLHDFYCSLKTVRVT